MEDGAISATPSSPHASATRLVAAKVLLLGMLLEMVDQVVAVVLGVLQMAAQEQQGKAMMVEMV